MATDTQPSLTAALAETSAEPVVAGDNRPAELQALTSHLANVTLPTDPEAEAEELIHAVDGVKLPKTLKDTLKMLDEAQQSKPTDARDEKRKVLLLEKLTEHIHALSQGTPPPVIQGEQHTVLTSAHSAHAEDIHLTLLCRTDRIVAERLKRDGATIKLLQAKIAELSKK